MRGRDLHIAPLCKAALILVAGLAAYSVDKPLFRVSLRPTAFELVATPGRRYNIIADIR